jgi:hypothetical protein
VWCVVEALNSWALRYSQEPATCMLGSFNEALTNHRSEDFQFTLIIILT